MSDDWKFEFTLDEDGTLSLKSAVFQALGAASMCWSQVIKAGTFQSERAQEIGEELLKKILLEKYPESIEGYIDIGPYAFADSETKVINYKGSNYYKACDAFVTNRENGGQTFCVLRVGHPSYLHQDYDGNTRGDHD